MTYMDHESHWWYKQKTPIGPGLDRNPLLELSD